MSQKSTGRAGVVSAPSDANSMDKLASAVLDDLLYNVVHDLLMKTHHDEKQARSATAAIRVETMAAEAAQDLAGATGESKPEGHYETDAAAYENGQVTLKSNPLKNTHDILCPRCHLPRLLYPTDGRGARKPDPGVTYCKKHPYIDKPGCDIYGQMWVAPGPGRGKKKKDFDKKVSAAIHAATTGIETPNGSGNGTVTEQRPPNVLSFPSATCSKCKRCILVSRLNNHMGSCIGNSGRNASRAAAQKISNGSSNGHGNGGGSSTPNHDHTPPSSQKGTPRPGSQAASPRKRDADDFDDGEDESDAANHTKPKKKFKTSTSHGSNGTSTPTGQNNNLSVALSKKLTLKMKNGTSAAAAAAAVASKKQKAKPSSALSFERKANNNNNSSHNNDGDHSNYEDDGDDDDDDDDDDGRSGSHGAGHTGGGGSGSGSGVVRSITFKGAAAPTSTSSSTPKKKKQQLGASSSAATSTSTPPKKTTKVPIPIPGPKKVKLINKTTPLSPPASKNGRVGRDVDVGSESSETMSSPRA